MRFLIYIAIMLIPFTGAAQNDTIRSLDEFNKAPEDLKKLIEEISEAVEEQSVEEADIEIDGLLFDETLTKSGRDFYEYFYSHWEAPPGAKNYSIYIGEKPFRLFTTLMEIKINENLVYQALLQPRGDYVTQIASEAIQRAQAFLINYEEIMRQLESEDKSGTGIF